MTEAGVVFFTPGLKEALEELESALLDRRKFSAKLTEDIRNVEDALHSWNAPKAESGFLSWDIYRGSNSNKYRILYGDCEEGVPLSGCEYGIKAAQIGELHKLFTAIKEACHVK